MLRSRVLSSIDTSRLAEAVARPGIDPRVWVSYAILTGDPVIETAQGQQDVFVDVLLLPQNQPDTARVGAIYAGNGFGLYAPLKKDDEVLVCAPSGDPDEGLVVMQRLWSPSDVPPAEAAAYPNDVLLVVEPGQNVRIAVSGGGKVALGSVDATKGVARLDDEVNIGDKTVTLIPVVPPTVPPTFVYIETVTDARGTIISQTAPLPWVQNVSPDPGVTPLVGLVSSASETVVSA